MIILNLAHPITPAQHHTIETLTGQSVQEVVAIPCYFDVERSFAEQARELLDGVGWSATQWQTTPMVVNLPAHSTIAATVLAELHGRLGYFPTILRLRPVPDTTPTQFEIAEVLNLQAIRERARQERQAMPNATP